MGGAGMATRNVNKPTKPQPPAALPPLGPPHYRGPQGDTTDAATVAAEERLGELRRQYRNKRKDHE